MRRFVARRRRSSGGAVAAMTAFDLDGKVAVVTGGNGGLGLGMAQGLAEAGAKIAIWARNWQKTEAAIGRLNGAAGTSIGLQVDVRDDGEIANAAADTVRRLGGIDILINNAGTSVRGTPEELNVGDYIDVMNVNLTAALRCAKAVYPAMAAQKRGKIINIGSMMSIYGSPFSLPYSVSKGGLVQLTKSLAIAWAKDGICVNAILPGWFETELTAGTRRHVPGLYEKIVERTPARRWGLPDDLAGTAIYLSAPASDFVTGTCICIDGGFSAGI